MNPAKIAKIIEDHSPDTDTGHFANERFCRACRESIRVWPWNEFPNHQADLIEMEYQKSQKSLIRRWLKRFR